MRRPFALAGAALSLGVLAGCGSAPGGGDRVPAVVVEQRSDTGGGYAGREVQPGYALPAATLTGDDGNQVRLRKDLDAPVRVFFFGYTSCPDVCSLIMADLALAVARLPETVADDVSVVLVSSDPERDTPQVLRTYLDRFDPDFTGLTGDLDTIVDVATAMGVAIEEGHRLPSGGYEVTHGSELIGYLGDDGVVVWPLGTSVEDLSGDLARLVADTRRG